ncbi:hypothetical protein [Carboxylicivirga caseinilyticus]|uniref:hypothetical protein n=1 Tax=Carboxylicivirga caseinilyticus TaxID=3417572 RepID=UPI003D34B30A|nr:hypothetical protein [Marinilabiliaceae bacterium A049]
MNYKSYTVLLFYILFSHWILAQNYTETIKHHRTSYVSPTATLELINKYGSIHVSTWDVDSVSIDIEFFIAEKNESKFNKIKENVDFKISGNSSFLSAETVFGSKYASFFSDIKEATNLMSSNKSSHIDYYVKVPEYINIKINNRYGNIFIPDFQGNLNIELANGDFQAKKITGSNILNLAFGNVLIEQLEQSSLSLNFSEVKIKDAGQLNLNSKSSMVSIDECNLIKLQSKRDEYNIGHIGFMFGDTYFSKMNIQNLDSEFNMILKYGELTHLGINPAFKLIRINSEYANCDLQLTNPVAYSSTIKGSKSEFEFANSITSAITDWQEKIQYEPVSFYYKNKTAKEKIQININDATLKIYHK